MTHISSSINKTIPLTIAAALMLTLISCTGTESQSIKNDKEPKNLCNENCPQPLIEKDNLNITSLNYVKETQSLESIRVMPRNTKKLAYTSYMVPNHVEPTPRDNYQTLDENGVKLVSNSPLSTFSIDVDTGSYANVRRYLNQGTLPPADAVRIEEMLNYFDYQQSAPTNNEHPFSVKTEMMTAPWNSDRKLLKIALKGYELPKRKLGNANLVFLLDVSGSMNSPHKLPLLKRSLTLLTNQLDANDKVSIVVYAGAAGVVLEPTAGNNKTKIERALNQLSAGGSTNGGQGIELAYSIAQEQFIKNGINRVILATDGDFNVGTSNIDTLKQLIAKKREQGITLTTLGFGQGNYNDYLMEQMADVGNGNYAYIDNINEARKVLVDQLSSTLKTIAHDVKIQVEFNPNIVSEYRLIGYENRALANEDFNNDKVDAGEIGAGHQVTALYELTLTDSNNKAIEPLRYQDKQKVNNKNNEIAFVKLRYKLPKETTSKLINHSINRDLLTKSPTDNFKFASSVAAFAQSLKSGKYLNDYSIEDMITLAKANKGDDNYGYRSEFIQLLRSAQTLSTVK